MCTKSMCVCAYRRPFEKTLEISVDGSEIGGRRTQSIGSSSKPMVSSCCLDGEENEPKAKVEIEALPKSRSRLDSSSVLGNSQTQLTWVNPRLSTRHTLPLLSKDKHLMLDRAQPLV